MWPFRKVDLADYAAQRLEGADVQQLYREAEQLRNQAEAIRKMVEDRCHTSPNCLNVRDSALARATVDATHQQNS
jgi:hypothetical protein